MTEVLARLASSHGRNDELLNIALAKDIASKNDIAGVRELVANFRNPSKDIQSDCVKVLYEVGALRPALIQDYVGEFVELLKSRNNRLVWGAMTALGSIAHLKSAEIGRHAEAVMEATRTGSVITQDWGIRVLAEVSASGPAARARVFPFLLDFLGGCPGKDVPRHAESVRAAVDRQSKKETLQVLEMRRLELKPAQLQRLSKVIRKIESL